MRLGSTPKENVLQQWNFRNRRNQLLGCFDCLALEWQWVWRSCWKSKLDKATHQNRLLIKPHVHSEAVGVGPSRNAWLSPFLCPTCIQKAKQKNSIHLHPANAVIVLFFSYFKLSRLLNIHWTREMKLWWSSFGAFLVLISMSPPKWDSVIIYCLNWVQQLPPGGTKLQTASEGWKLTGCLVIEKAGAS